MFSEMLYLPIRMVLALANTVAFIWTCIYGSILEVWQSVSSIFKLASATNTAVSSTYEASMWRSLWNDLFSQVLLQSVASFHFSGRTKWISFFYCFDL